MATGRAVIATIVMTLSLCLSAQENRDDFWFSPLAPNFWTFEWSPLTSKTEWFAPLRADTPRRLPQRQSHRQHTAIAAHIEQAVRILTTVQAASSPLAVPPVGSDDIIITPPPPITDDPEPPVNEPESPIHGVVDPGWTFIPVETRHNQPSKEEAARFLQQASFGARPGDIERVQKMGIKRWLHWQKDLPRSMHLTLMDDWYRAGGLDELRQQDRADVWWHHALYGEDQLRQRIAFALSQIFVISRNSFKLFYSPKVMAHYYDQLSLHALGNYRELLEAVTLSPAMGTYLSMMGNRKADSARNRYPDENYAREVMQLFSIGLHQLNPDGTPQLDDNGAFVPTYQQADIEALARVLTGWMEPVGGCLQCDNNSAWFQNMPMEEAAHDSDEKWVMGEYFPAGQGMEADLKQALDLLFDHPNTPPFISHQLIQRLTHSNPSPAYVGRVAEVFQDNGEGVRGDLFAVVKAILLDRENQPKRHLKPRKVREPLIAMASLARSLEMRMVSERMIDYFRTYSGYGQAPLAAPSVFNFYRPEYSQGVLEERRWAAPELEILGWNNYINLNNQLWRMIQSHGDGPDGALTYDLGPLTDLAAQSVAFVQWIDLNLLAGRMSHSLKTLLLEHLQSIPPSEHERRIEETLYLAVSAPEFLYQE